MTIIAHISDLHISDNAFDEAVFMQAVTEINNLQPDMIILSGDVTNNGYYRQYQQAIKYLDMFDAPLFAVPGNHDARNLGKIEGMSVILSACGWNINWINV